MAEQTQQDPAGVAGQGAEQDRPLGAYATLTGTLLTTAGGFAVWLGRSGIEPPDRIAPSDLALVSVATHKLSRLIARDRTTSGPPSLVFKTTQTRPSPTKPRAVNGSSARSESC